MATWEFSGSRGLGWSNGGEQTQPSLPAQEAGKAIPQWADIRPGAIVYVKVPYFIAKPEDYWD